MLSNNSSSDHALPFMTLQDADFEKNACTGWGPGPVGQILVDVQGKSLQGVQEHFLKGNHLPLKQFVLLS